MAKRAVIDIGTTMVAMITDVLEHVEVKASLEVNVGDRVRITSGLYQGEVGEVRLMTEDDRSDEPRRASPESREEVA